MKQSEITPCAVCGKKLMEGGNIMWWRVFVTQEVADLGALRRAAGLEMMIGGLAQFMGPDEDIAKAMPTVTGRVCQTCVCDPEMSIAVLVERLGEVAARKEGP